MSCSALRAAERCKLLRKANAERIDGRQRSEKYAVIKKLRSKRFHETD